MMPIAKLYTYKHISFDLWLTLIKSNPLFKEKRNLLFKEFFSIERHIDEVAATIRKFDVLTNVINEKVGRNFDTFEIYYLIINELGRDISRFSKNHLEEFYRLTENLLMQNVPMLLDQDIITMLHSLKESGKTINVLSNTAFIKGISLRKVLLHHEIDQFFNFQVYSDEIGYSKPSMEIYAYTYDKIKQLGPIEKNQVLHIGDNVISDYEGALKFGFSAHLFTNNKNEFKLQPA